MYAFYFLPIALALAILLPGAAVAQFMGGAGDTSDAGTAFSASIDPQYPAPYSQATLSVLSPTLDLTDATMKVSSK